MPVYVNIIIIFCLFFINAIFAMYEIAMVSSRKTRLEQRVDDGLKGATDALELAKDPDQEYLSAIQIMITLIDTLAGSIGGAMIADPLAAWLAPILGLSSALVETIALILVVVLITYFSIVLGELLPKRIAVSHPEDVVTRLSPMVKGLTRFLRPLTRLLSGSTNLGIKILRIDVSREPAITEEELKGYIEEGRLSGVFNESEQDMVSGVFRLSDRRVDALMTPYTELAWLDLEDSHEEIVRQLRESEYSKLPVARGELDNLLGILNIKNLIGVNIDDPSFSVEKYMREPLFFPENKPAIDAFNQFRETGIHQALVIDEYGGVQGMVTLYDVLESIVGVIPQDENDLDQDVVQREDGSWSFDGLLPIDELKDILGVDELPEEDKAGYQTLSGFVMNQLSSIPRVGQVFQWQQYRFEVLDMDGRRVDRMMVSDLSRQNPTETA